MRQDAGGIPIPITAGDHLAVLEEIWSTPLTDAFLVPAWIARIDISREIRRESLEWLFRFRVNNPEEFKKACEAANLNAKFKKQLEQLFEKYA